MKQTDIHKVKWLLAIINSADAISLGDFSPLMATWEKFPALGDPENEVLRFSWVDTKLNCSCSEVITEDCLARAEVKANGEVHISDDGDVLVLKTFSLQQRAIHLINEFSPMPSFKDFVASKRKVDCLQTEIGEDLGKPNVKGYAYEQGVYIEIINDKQYRLFLCNNLQSNNLAELERLIYQNLDRL